MPSYRAEVRRMRKKKPVNHRKECLALWSKCVRTRDRKCQVCGSDYRLQAHHIRSVTHHSTMLDLENGLTLCSRCHFLQKANPERFQDMILETIGQKEYDRLKKKSQHTMKYITRDYKDMKDYLRNKLTSFEQDYGVLV